MCFPSIKCPNLDVSVVEFLATANKSLFLENNTKTNTYLSCRSEICKKTASYEKFRLEINLYFLKK